MKHYGVEYHTREAAEKANKAMRTHNRLLAWVSENDDGWKPDWNDDTQHKYYLSKYYSKYVPQAITAYNVGHNSYLPSMNTIYMSKQNALKLCKLLNDGIVIL